MLEKTSNEHTEAVRAYSSWLKSFEDWKAANKDHPDRQAFAEYVQQIIIKFSYGSSSLEDPPFSFIVLLVLVDTSVTSRLNAPD